MFISSDDMLKRNLCLNGVYRYRLFKLDDIDWSSIKRMVSFDKDIYNELNELVIKFQLTSENYYYNIDTPDSNYWRKRIFSSGVEVDNGYGTLDYHEVVHKNGLNYYYEESNGFRFKRVYSNGVKKDFKCSSDNSKWEETTFNDGNSIKLLLSIEFK